MKVLRRIRVHWSFYRMYRRWGWTDIWGRRIPEKWGKAKGTSRALEASKFKRTLEEL